MAVSKPGTTKAKSTRYPMLRGALWLYFLILCGMLIAFYFPSTSVPRVFLDMIAGLFIVGGFTGAAIFINQIPVQPLLGRRPLPINLIVSFLAGVAVWVPASWISGIPLAWLNVNVGNVLSTTQAQLAFTLDQSVPGGFNLIVLGLIVPISQGLFFWAYLRRAAETQGRGWSIILVTGLYGLFGLYSSRLGLSAIPAALFVGLVGTLAVYLTDSAWCGIALLVGYNLAAQIIGTLVYNYLDWVNHADEASNPFSTRWLLLVIVTVFVTFLLVQVMRSTANRADGSPRAKQAADAAENANMMPPHTLAKRWWWLPIALSLTLSLILGFGEFVTRELNPPLPAGSFQIPGNGSTFPPVAQPTVVQPTVIPTVPGIPNK